MRVKLRKSSVVAVTCLLLLLVYKHIWNETFKSKTGLDFNEHVLINDELCQPVHVAVICAGHESSRQIVILLKSILFYRSKPLHLHIVVDEVSEHILTNLFRTWDIPNFAVSFYLDKRHLPDVTWFENTHYSGVYGLLKLKLPEILSDNIEQVIVLDTDLLFNSDIVELWNIFNFFSANQCLGMADNLSEWYLGMVLYFENVWPAIGRGFNSGVMLLKLDTLRLLKWNHLWKKVTRETLVTHHQTQLADQDILNAVLKKNPSLLYRLPCVWNFQLSNNMKEEFCSNLSSIRVKVYHWNSPEKQKSKYSYVHGAKNLYQRFAELNGALVKEPLLQCSQTESKIHKDNDEYEDDLCVKLIQSTSLHRIHLYFIPFEYESMSDRDVTMVLQLSIDRIAVFEKVCSHWPGPISAAIFASDQDVQNLPMFVEQITGEEDDDLS